MNQTIGELHCKHLAKTIGGRRVIELAKSFRYRCWTQNFRIIVIVPRGFQCDLASIPRLLWPLLPPGEYDEAAVLHDYLYTVGVPRWLSDSVFRHVLQGTGIRLWKRCALFWGVRFGGWVAWRKHRK